ncbi:MAG: hypothetical protein AAGA58_06595, partial [Verrucomicrobiota bacterium]
MKRGNLFLCLLVLTVSACDQAEDVVSGQEKTSSVPQLPAKRTITDVDGRKLEVEITGRTADKVRFVRLSDKAEYEFAIERLSEVDREFVSQLPVSESVSPKKDKVATGPADQKLADRKDWYETRIREYETRLAKKNLTTLQR